jgi:diguanylate cyclase (GGDEF)-like protein
MPAEKQRVLIVDDSKIVRTTISRLIRTSFDVREEADGEAGWNALEGDTSICVLISDIQMPKLDGFGLLQKIREASDPRIRDMPVIMISGNEDDATKKKARAAGANDFITKSTDGTEILSRIDNLLRLVQTKSELETHREVVNTTTTRDPLTGAFTPHYLVTEGTKHFSHARRHGGPLSVVTFRIESYNDIVHKVGKEVADQLLARVAKLVLASLRAEDSMARMAETTFTIVSPSTSAQQAMAFAKRLRDQLEAAKVNYRDHVLKIRASIGISSLGHDAATTIDELLKTASQRLERAAQQGEQRIVEQDEVNVVKPVTLPSDIERAVQALEQANPERLGEAASEVVRRLLPFLEAACARVHISLPTDKILQALKSRHR